jgi:hypothetical protein
MRYFRRRKNTGENKHSEKSAGSETRTNGSSRRREAIEENNGSDRTYYEGLERDGEGKAGEASHAVAA